MHCLLFLSIALGLTLVSATPINDVDHMEYLRKFGYLSKDQSNFVEDTDISIVKAISDFQEMAGIQQTGSMNEETIAMMSLPRCGHHDNEVYHKHGRSKRYALLGTVWRHRAITYKITKYTTQLQNRDVDNEVRKAFNFWAKVSPLTFRKVQPYENSDIDIKFVSGRHGDGSPFDGKLGVLAHAYQPENGRAHFDDAEEWVLGDHTYGKINIGQVMTHEFGHLLGLGHSRKNAAVMAPFYKGYEPNFHLDIDDINGIRAMYGSGNGGRRTTTTTSYTTTTTERYTTKRSTSGNICDDPTFDAITMDTSGTILGFKGSNYYKIHTWDPKRAHPIRSTYPGLPSNIDSALTIRGFSYFIKGGYVYKFRYSRLQSGYPKSLSREFRGLPSNIDAAFAIRSTAYFISNGKYYKASVSNGYAGRAVVTTSYRNSPSRIDGMFNWPNYGVIAFSGDKYYTSYVHNRNFGSSHNTKRWLKC